MNEICFPGLGLNITVSKIAFQIFGITIYWYAVLIVLAIILALALLKIKEGLYGITFDKILKLGVYLIPICLISARLYYIIFKWEYFSANLQEILNIRSGGLAIYGGIIGGFFTCYVFCKKNKIQLLNLLDYIVPMAALRPSDRQMGKFCKCRSLRSRNNNSFKNGNMGKRNL